jgi:Gamma-aminobutyrate permease and related permeases
MPGYPLTSWLTIIFFFSVLVILLFIDTTRIPLIISAVIFVLLAIGFNYTPKGKKK